METDTMQKNKAYIYIQDEKEKKYSLPLVVIIIHIKSRVCTGKINMSLHCPQLHGHLENFMKTFGPKLEVLGARG